MSADSVYALANWFLVGALLVGVAATYAIVASGKIRDEKLNKELEAQRTINAELAKETADAKLDAAKAKERAAEIMKATAWRQFENAQRDAIVSVLSKRTATIRLIWIANDPESLGLATQFADILNVIHWKIAGASNSYPSQLLWDVWIPDCKQDMATTIALRAAFSAARIHFSTQDLPIPSMQMGGGGADFATVLIGSKRPNLVQPPN